MVKEKFLILFFMFNQIIPMHFSQNVSKTDNTFIELELFHERIFNYRAADCYSSCWNIVMNHHCQSITPYRELTTETSCEITSCAWLGHGEACISPRAHPKIQWVTAVRDKATYRYGKNYDYCPKKEGFIHYGLLDRNFEYWNSCNCHCVRANWRVYLWELRSRESDNYKFSIISRKLSKIERFCSNPFLVIVNVRFQAKDKVLFLQPAEGRLEANGSISNVSWIPLPDNPGVTHSINVNFRIFFLNDVRLRPDYVLTGVKFELIESLMPKSIRGFSIAVDGLPFDYNTGKLDLSHFKRRYTRTNQYIYRQPLLFVRKNPIDGKDKHSYQRSRRQHNYVTLEQSELSGDLSQSTLPLFYNYYPNKINQYSALSGIGIFHYGSQDNSGFFALELFPIDLMQFL